MGRQLLFAVGILLAATAVVFLWSAAYSTAFRDEFDVCSSITGDAAACVDANRGKNAVELHMSQWILGGALAATSALVLLSPRAARSLRARSAA